MGHGSTIGHARNFYSGIRPGGKGGCWQRSLSPVCAGGHEFVDVFLHRNEPGGQFHYRGARHDSEDLLSSLGYPTLQGSGGTGRLVSRTAVAVLRDGLVSLRAIGQRYFPAFIYSAQRVGFPGSRHLVKHPHCSLSRFSVCSALHGSIRIVRHTRGLSVVVSTRRVPVGILP